MNLQRSGEYTHTPMHTQMEYYSAIKRLRFDICNNTDGPGGYYAYWSNSGRER